MRYALSSDSWLAPDEAARILGLSYHQLNRAIASRWVRVVRLPSGHRRISRADVERLLADGLLDPPRRSGAAPNGVAQ
ncbi:MAG: excisionase family DNA-binding protein [Chloroflexota bacterium]|nr:excisionase family DNA-binding protein [Chloroflexota bacterium]